MAEIVSLIKVVAVCGTAVLIGFLVLLALPQSRLRSVCLEFAKWLIAVGLVLLTVSPIDLIPDVIPIAGWLDDLGYVITGICAVRSAIGERKARAELPE